MSSKKGMLVVLEGIDGSGKGTQAKMLLSSLTTLGFNAKMISFPDYETSFFGQEVGAYLRGEFGGLNDVHPKLASILFAGDRFEHKATIERLLDDGYIVICDRYAESNMAHQAAKLPVEEQGGLIEWLDTLEYSIFKIPRPDVTVYLDLPVAVSQELVLKKAARNYTDAKQDIHEADSSFLSKSADCYQKLAKMNNWKSIQCVENSELKSLNAIQTELVKLVTEMYQQR